MLATTITSALQGIEGFPVRVEVDVSRGLPDFIIVGLPNMAVKEAKERVRAAIINSGFEFPVKKITINLSPGDLKKTGTHFDLPIALGILAATKQIKGDMISSFVSMGELSLDGSIREVRGILPMILGARENNLHNLLIPKGNIAEACVASEVNIYGACNLKQVVSFFQSESKLKKNNLSTSYENIITYSNDFKNIKGQNAARRALEIAATGGHNLLMQGSPGSGKTLLASCLPSILPSMTEKESLEVTKIYSISGLLSSGQGNVTQRPFRNPHHSISTIALVGGGHNPRPGEVTLSHRGVLFLDEIPEFNRNALEVLRQPMEDGNVTIARASYSITYPAQFTLVASSNPCKCGYWGDTLKDCTCTDTDINKYQGKLSGPLIDRMDIFLEVARLEYSELTEKVEAENSENIRQRVEEARQRQQHNLASEDLLYNAQLKHHHLKKHCQLDRESQLMMKEAFHRLKLSARAYDRILKLSRTIADMEGKENIQSHHLAEALQYRLAN